MPVEIHTHEIQSDEYEFWLGMYIKKIKKK